MGRGDHRAPAEEEGGRHDVELHPLLAAEAQRLGHVGRLHEAVAQGHPAEILVEGGDLNPIHGRHPGNVGGLDGQDHVLPVQHAVVLEVMHQGDRRDVRVGGQEHGRALDPVRRAGLEGLGQVGHRNGVPMGLGGEDPRAAGPGPHDQHQPGAEHHREPAALGELQGVGAEEGQVDQQEGRAQGRRGPQRHTDTES